MSKKLIGMKKDIVFNKNRLSVFYFSMLADWILHSSRALTLLPLGFARWKTSYLLLLPGTSARWTSCVTHYVVVMKAGSLRDHICESTSIGEHLVLISASNEDIGDQALIFVVCLLVSAWISSAVTRCSLILPLALNIDWWLRSYSVLGWCWARFLGVTPLFSNHLTIESMRLITRHVTWQKIIMLLCDAKWIRGRAIDVVSALLRQALSVRARWSLLCSTRTQSVIIVLTWAKTSLTSLISLLRVGVLATWHSLPATHNVTGRLDHTMMAVVHFVVEGRCSHGPTRFENT